MESPKPNPLSKKGKKKIKFFETHIQRIIKKISKDNSINSNTKQQLNNILIIICKKLSLVMLNLCKNSKKKTINSEDVRRAVSLGFPPNLKTESLEYLDSQTAAEWKKNLQIPPSIIEKFIRGQGYYKIMVTSEAPQTLAVIIEYITIRILTLSLKECKKVRITIRNMYLGIYQNTDFKELFDKFNIQILGGGVVPFIEPTLIPVKPQTNKIRISGSNQHKFRPGILSLKEIKKYQKLNNCLMLCKSPVQKIIRKIIAERSPESIKISRDVFIILQYYIEQYTVNILKNANKIAIHSGRVKLIKKDIDLLYKLKI